MIIIMLNDDFHKKLARLVILQCAKKGKIEIFAVFKAGCFNDMAPTDNRVTFIGHASSTHFDKHTPDEFVDCLIKYGLPERVTIIDLLGCEIGFFTTKGDSYAESVTTGLSFQFPTTIIQVNALTNSDSNLKDGGMLVCFDQDNEKIYAVEFDASNMKIINELQKKLDSLKENKHMYIEQRDKIAAQLAPMLTQSDTIISATSSSLTAHDLNSEFDKVNKKITAINEKIDKIEEQLEENIKRGNKIKLFKKDTEDSKDIKNTEDTDDIRGVLDRNPRFQFKSQPISSSISATTAAASTSASASASAASGSPSPTSSTPGTITSVVVPNPSILPTPPPNQSAMPTASTVISDSAAADTKESAAPVSQSSTPPPPEGQAKMPAAIRAAAFVLEKLKDCCNCFKRK